MLSWHIHGVNLTEVLFDTCQAVESGSDDNGFCVILIHFRVHESLHELHKGHHQQVCTTLEHVQELMMCRVPIMEPARKLDCAAPRKRFLAVQMTMRTTISACHA
jgi:hypothetical protein